MEDTGDPGAGGTGTLFVNDAQVGQGRIDNTVGYTFSLDEGMDVGIEIRNAFDESPPYVNLAPSVNGSGGYDASTTNPVGRMFAISLRKKW